MTKRLTLIALTLSLFATVTLISTQNQGDPTLTEVWEPIPAVITPGDWTSAPSDAIQLFDGTDLSAWTGLDNEAMWNVDDGILTVTGGTGDIKTKQAFGDVQLHIEWQTPTEVAGDGQDRGNSGVYLMSRYEIQVLDSFNNRTYSNGQAGSVYKQFSPLVNASREPGEWQVYDIIFLAPRFNDADGVTTPARLTVLHNGVLIQNHVPIKGSSVFIGDPTYEAHPPKAPLLLQDHSNPVSYRNIWIREL